MSQSIQSAVYSETLTGRHTHYHDCHQLLYIVSGEADVAIGGETVRAKAGSLTIFSRFEEHSVTPLGADYCRYTLRLSPQTEERFASILVNRAQGFRHVVYAPEAESLFCAILEEFTSDSPWREEMLEALLRQLLVRICRLMPQAAAAAEAPGAAVVRNIQRRFETHCAEQVRLSDLAREYHLSTSYLSHMFKMVTGASVMGYLQACRVTAAKKLLATTDMSVGSIVEACGFKDCSNFSQLFRRETGMTPSQFRKNQRYGKITKSCTDNL